MPNNLFRFLSDKNKKARLNSLRHAVTPILSNNIQTEFTDHSCDHSDAAARLIDSLIAPIQDGPDRLTDRELFVVYAACYTHDIGMQYQNAGATPTIQKLGLSLAWEHLSGEERGQYLRIYHNEISADMVMASVRSAAPPIGLALNDDDDPNLIAALCDAHIVDSESTRYLELMQGAHGTVRMDLLSGLLRMADILEESRRRANRIKAETLLLPLLSRAHWWRHYYTKDVVFDPAGKTVTLVFDFPSSKRDEYARIVPQLHWPNIQRELHRHGVPFAKYGIHWIIQSRIDQPAYSTAEEMPSAVEAEMLALLKNQADDEAAERRRHQVEAFEQARPLIARLLDEVDQLPVTALPAEKIDKLEQVAAQLHSFSAPYTEETVVEQIHRLAEQTGDAKRQMEWGLRLIALQLTLHPSVSLNNIISGCERIAAAAQATSEQRLDLACLKARLFNDLGAYPELKEAYEAAIAQARALGNTLLAQEVTVELGEALYLLGKAGEAVSTLSPVTDDPVLPEQIKDQRGKPAPAVRAASVLARLSARGGNATEALSRLEILQQRTATPDATLSRTHLLNAQAYVRFLLGQPVEAASLLTAGLQSLSLADQPALDIALERNRRLCFNLATLQTQLRQHDAMRDAVRIVGAGDDYALSVLSALDLQREGKHHEAWPIFWRELREAYQSEAWQRYQEAEEYLGWEHLAIGIFSGATYHAVLALSEPLAAAGCEHLLASQQPQAIRQTLDNLMECQIDLYFVRACQIIRLLADAIPDDLIGSTVDYLLRKASAEFEILTSRDTARPAWEALEALGSRLSKSIAENVLLHISLLEWRDVNEFLKKAIFKVVKSLIPTLSPEGLARATDITLPHAVHYPQNGNHQIYYSEALNTVAEIASRAEDPLKDKISRSLFPPEGVQADAQKLQLLPLFPAVQITALGVDELALGVARGLRYQVETRMPGDISVSGTPVAVLMEQFRTLPDGSKCITRYTDLTGLHAAVTQISAMQPAAFQSLLDACLDMVALPDNFISNRIGIISGMTRMASHLSEDQRGAVRQILEPIAKGEGVSDADRLQSEAAHNPFNAFRINLGEPVDLQGAALDVLVSLEQTEQDASLDKVWELLEQAIVSAHSALRLKAHHATLGLPELNESLLVALICGLRDPSVEIAEVCYWSLVRKKSLILNGFQIGLILTSIQLARHSPDLQIRRGAAGLATRLQRTLPEEASQKAEIANLLQQFADDICFSVRDQQPREIPDVNSTS